MKKIKLLSLALAVIMLLSAFAGCGNKDTDKSDSSKDNSQSETNDNNSETNNNSSDSTNKKITSKEEFVGEMGELLDLSLYSELDETITSLSQTYTYNLDHKNKTDYNLDYTISFNDGSGFTLPITFSELEKKGWSIDPFYGPDNDIPTNGVTGCKIIHSSGKVLGVSVYNPTNKTIKLKECTVTGVDTGSSGVDFTVCGALSTSSTTENIINKLGNPTFSACVILLDGNGEYKESNVVLSYSQNTTEGSITFTLSGDDNRLIDIDYKIS